MALLIAGVDEAGRGPLVGSVFAAAVILPADYDLPGLTDSKKLSEKKRDSLAIAIKEQALAWHVAEANVAEIAELNILHATMLAMQRAVAGLKITPEYVLIDGNRCPNTAIPTKYVIKGDAHSASIAAASILAKVTRDRYMQQLALEYPQYQLEKHKGYPTKLHYALLQQYGIQSFYRKSFLKNMV